MNIDEVFGFSDLYYLTKIAAQVFFILINLFLKGK
jgi:hypothetical protein